MNMDGRVPSSSGDINPRKRQRIDRLDSQILDPVCNHTSSIADDKVGEINDGAEEEKVPKTIDDIFDTLLQHVFSFCDAEEVFGSLSQVCTRWERIAHDPRTLSHCQLVLDGEREAACIDVLKRAPYLDNVFILPGHSENVLRALMEGSVLHGLTITVLLPHSQISSLLAHNEGHLKRLSMIVDDRVLAQGDIQFTIVKMPRLSFLHLAGESFISCPDAGITELEQFPPLKTVRLEQLLFHETKPTFILSLLAVCKDTITTLSLPCMYGQSLFETGILQGSCVEKVSVCSGCLRIITQMACLTSLHIVGCVHMSEDASGSWTSKLRVLSNIKCLTLENFYELNKRPSIHSGKCFEECLVYGVISKCTRLDSFLVMGGCLSVETFNVILKNNSSLKEIQLYDFSGFENTEQITLIEKSNPNLKYINVSMTNISDSMVRALQDFESRVPNLRIDYPDPDLD